MAGEPWLKKPGRRAMGETAISFTWLMLTTWRGLWQNGFLTVTETLNLYWTGIALGTGEDVSLPGSTESTFTPRMEIMRAGLSRVCSMTQATEFSAS